MVKDLIEKLSRDHRLTHREWVQIFEHYTEADALYAQQLAREITVSIFGRKIYFRGIVEYSNICKNDCHYCGIRCGNHKVSRYRLSREDILACCQEGYDQGFRTFVLQGGEDGWFTDDRMCVIVSAIKEKFPDCAVTLSMGERSRESYEKLYKAGADRYLLRHETADEDHYRILHPENMSLNNRMGCLKDLKEIGFQTGCGMMVGSPDQTSETLAKDMCFLQEFQPQMVGVGPFIPHGDTPLGQEKKGSVELTLFIHALCRILLPRCLMPATTALGTADSDGRKLGVLAGCNVVMPNLSPEQVRKKYMLYDNKAGTDLTAAEGIALLRWQMEEIGYEVVIGRGDYRKEDA